MRAVLPLEHGRKRHLHRRRLRVSGAGMDAERQGVPAPAAPDELWREYFDLDRDYAAATRSFDCGEYLAQCVEFGRGIRILRQDRWEALCSFIISQCNNITRIKGIVERLCAMFGDELEFEGGAFLFFPPAERLAALEPGALDVLRCGYRAPYIRSERRPSRTEALGAWMLDRLAAEDARRRRRSEAQRRRQKVANCVVLFGLYHGGIPDRRVDKAARSRRTSPRTSTPRRSANMPVLPSSTYLLRPQPRK